MGQIAPDSTAIAAAQRDGALLGVYFMTVDKENEPWMKWVGKRFDSDQGSESRVALSREGA